MKDLKCPNCGSGKVGSLLIVDALWWCEDCKVHFDDNGAVHYQRVSFCCDEEYLKAFKNGIWRVESK